MITAGASAYPRIIDFERMREIADAVGALLFVDMAHISGLVAGGMHPSPVPHAHLVSTTTHKSLRGPRGGLILSRAEHASRIDRSVFPGLQGGPHMNAVAGVAVSAREDLSQCRHLPPTSGVVLDLVDGSRVIVRPSGTEPKIKAYLEVIESEVLEGEADRARDATNRRLDHLAAAVESLLGGG